MFSQDITFDKIYGNATFELNQGIAFTLGNTFDIGTSTKRLYKLWTYLIDCAGTVLTQVISHNPTDLALTLSTSNNILKKVVLQSYDTAYRQNVECVGGQVKFRSGATLVAETTGGLLDIPKGGNVDVAENKRLVLPLFDSMPSPSYRGQMIIYKTWEIEELQDRMYVAIYDDTGTLTWKQVTLT